MPDLDIVSPVRDVRDIGDPTGSTPWVGTVIAKPASQCTCDEMKSDLVSSAPNGLSSGSMNSPGHVDNGSERKQRVGFRVNAGIRVDNVTRGNRWSAPATPATNSFRTHSFVAGRVSVDGIDATFGNGTLAAIANDSPFRHGFD